MQEFDVAIIGSGAWSLPLAAHTKRLDKIGLILGGTLNLLFGICEGSFDKHGIYNEHWKLPGNFSAPRKWSALVVFFVAT